mgnify:FL=1
MTKTLEQLEQETIDAVNRWELDLEFKDGASRAGVATALEEAAHFIDEVVEKLEPNSYMAKRLARMVRVLDGLK